MSLLQNLFRFPKKRVKISNDAFASVFADDPQKPPKISGASALKNVFTVLEILVNF